MNKLLTSLSLAALLVSNSASALIKVPSFETASYQVSISMGDVVGTIWKAAEGMSKESLTTENAISGKAKIYVAVDGDTLIMNFSPSDYQRFKDVANTPAKKEHLTDKYRSVKVRIGGINTAESVHKNKSLNTAEGKDASNYLASWVNGKQATYTCYQHGKYGRPVCSVAVGKRDIGFQMISEGYSDYVTAWGNHPYYHKQYRQAAAK